jgi:hypothetical protein
MIKTPNNLRLTIYNRRNLTVNQNRKSTLFYQLDLVTPGISPVSANSLKQRRHN